MGVLCRKCKEQSRAELSPGRCRRRDGSTAALLHRPGRLVRLACEDASPGNAGTAGSADAKLPGPPDSIGLASNCELPGRYCAVQGGSLLQCGIQPFNPQYSPVAVSKAAAPRREGKMDGLQAIQY